MTIGLLWLAQVHGWRVLGLHWEYVGGCCAGARVGEGHLSIGRQWAPPWYLCIEHVERRPCSKIAGVCAAAQGKGVKMGSPRQDGGTFGLCLSYRNLGQEMMSRAGREAR